MKSILLVLLFCSCCMADNNFLSEKEMNNIEVKNSSGLAHHISTPLRKYVDGGVFPLVASYVDLKHSENLQALGEKELSDYLNVYFSYKDAYTYFYSLSQKDSQNMRYLEALLLSNKKTLVFLNITNVMNDSENTKIIREQEDSHILGAQGLLLIGFDHDARYFIAKSCDKNNYLWISYDYVKKHIRSSFYAQYTINENENNEIRNVNFEIHRWKVGSGNFFTPYARVSGTVKGHPAFIKWLRLVIEFRGKKRVVLKQIIVSPNDSFRFKEKYTRFGSKYCSIECMDNDFEVTRLIKRSVKE